MSLKNYTLKDEIRSYWSARAETFDNSPGHGIRSIGERDAWARLLRGHFEGSDVSEVLELASGTGEMTAVLLSMGLAVTAIDLCEPMIAKAAAKHVKAHKRVSFHLGDAENTMMPDQRFDAVVSRHLVWTLPDPDAAFADWLRVLRPGGRVVIVDGDWVTAPKRPSAWIARRIVGWLDKLDGTKPQSDEDTHQRFLSQVYFRDGLRRDRLCAMLTKAGFENIRHGGLESIWKEQVKTMSFKDRLSLGYWYWHYFIVSAQKPDTA
ncbi:methyltransferase domain-containing protein [Bradyrhizobium ontarionense]|uniref:Methyltransferase domain-containing protein n=1 Tax=Bradyrhizobium ontarionense TaxID=2898149 RepID=A0ABY3R5P9_9BRAD|nr:class I SAM-dependent methyltransferase [Bradyrhizobium sp. A19]UFZ02646.1 methyltransferase domain-containing protein [Bradyrhizobium sp. A19]